MLAKITAAVAALGAGSYLFHSTTTSDLTVFPQPRDEVQRILMEARTTLPGRDGSGSIQMWTARDTERGVMLNLQTAAWAPVLTCRIALIAVSPDTTRVLPECGSDGNHTSARARTLAEVHPFMFEEHVHAILNKRAFDRKTVDRRTVAVYSRNLAALQREARSLSIKTDPSGARQGR